MFEEIRYINNMGSQFRNFTQKDTYLWNFSCPLCGDSKKNKLKARGYLYRNNNTITFKCHNCNVSMSFGNFLKQVDPSLYQQYRYDSYEANHTNTPKKIKKEHASISKFEATYNSLKKTTKSKISLGNMVDINTLYTLKDLSDNQKFAIDYVVGRKLPKTSYSRIFYCDNFRSWVNSILPDKFKIIDNEFPKIVIPFYDSEKNIIGCQARSYLSGDTFDQKYLTAKFDKEKELTYGLDLVDWSQTVYVLEGPFDSMFIKNAVAVTSSSLHKKTQIDYTNAVLVYDNQPRSKEVLNEMKKAIKMGRLVYFWDEEVSSKDVNEFILDGNIIEDLNLKENSKSGIEATLKLQHWRRV